MVKWNRRQFLKAAGISASAAAMLPLFPIPQVEAIGGPKRMVMVTHGQGTDMTRWRPSGTENNFELSYILNPLEDYKSNLIVLDGIDNEPAYHGKAGGHFGMATMWTGVICPEGNVRSEGVGWPKAPSVDRLIADRIGQETPFDAFYWGTWPAAQNGGNQGPNGLCYYRASEQPIDPVLTPDRAFDQLFAGVTGDEAAVTKLRLERKSVLDLVRGELKRLQPQLPRVDRERMEAHLEGIRTLENRLVDLEGMCSVPAQPRGYSEAEKKDFRLHPEITQMQFELMAYAMACDLTRVACFQWPHSEGQGNFLESEGYDENFGSFHVLAHQMTYANVGDQPVTNEERVQARLSMANLNQWRAKMIKTHLLDNITPEVRDNTVLVWGSEMSEGGTHSNRNVPMVIFQGDEVNHFNTGRYLQYGSHDPTKPSEASREHGGEKINKVLVSLCHSMGLDDIDTVGNPEFGSGPLEDLT